MKRTPAKLAPKRRSKPNRKREKPLKPEPKPRPIAGRLEKVLERTGYRLVAGVDEVGRGALAGPLVTAAVLLDTSCVPGGLCDSKLLEPEERECLASVILTSAIAVSYVVVDNEDIDDEGLGVTNLLALNRAVRSLAPAPEYVISDHFPLDRCRVPHVGLPKADMMSAAVAAASIVAKVSRDAFMRTLDAEHPGYHFASNKGYGSDEHWAAIRALGPSPVHRRSFKGVATYQASFLET